MKLSAKTQARFEELIETAEKIKATKHTDRPVPGVIAPLHTWVDEYQARQWAMSALTILKSALGDGNDNYQQVKSNLEECALHRNFCIMQSCVKAALEDLQGGFFFEAKTLLEAEVFSSRLRNCKRLGTYILPPCWLGASLKSTCGPCVLVGTSASSSRTVSTR